MNFIVAGLAGVVATVFTNPLEVVKTRFQLRGELQDTKDETIGFRSVFNELNIIAKTEGILALQKGLVPNMFYDFTMNSVRLGLFHIAEVQGWLKSKSGNISIVKTVIWSAFTGIISAVISNPMSVVKVRMQSAGHQSITEGRRYEYNGLGDAFYTIMKTEGWKGYFSGLSATCARVAVGNTVQLTSYSATKKILQSHGMFTNSPFVFAFIASAISAVMVVIFICPLDVVSVRLYNQGWGSQGEILYTGVLDCIIKIYKTEGFLGLYKGIGPYYLRIAPNTTITLIAWDMFKQFM